MIGKPSSSFFLNKDTDHPLLDMVHQVRDDEPMRRVSRVAPDNHDESRRNSGIKEEIEQRADDAERHPGFSPWEAELPRDADSLLEEAVTSEPVSENSIPEAFWAVI